MQNLKSTNEHIYKPETNSDIENKHVVTKGEKRVKGPNRSVELTYIKLLYIN